MVKIASAALLALFVIVSMTKPLHVHCALEHGVFNSMNITTYLQFALDIYEMKDIAQNTNSAAGKDQMLLNIINKVRQFHSVIVSRETIMKESIFETNSLRTLTNNMTMNAVVHEFVPLITTVNSQISKLETILKMGSYKATTPPPILRKIINHNKDIYAASNISRFFFPDHFAKNMTKKYWDLLVMEEEICNLQKSPQEFLYDLYHAIIMTEIKNMFALFVTYKIQEIRGEGNFNDSVKTKYERIKHCNIAYRALFRTAIKRSSRNYHRCDPTHHIKGETFLEFDRFIGNVLVESGALDIGVRKDHKIYGKCRPGFYKQLFECIGEYGCEPTRQFCYGQINDCHHMPKGAIACQSKWKNLSARRFDWIKNIDNGEIYGNDNETCPDKRMMEKVEPVERGKGSYKYDSFVCRCTCTEDDSDGKGKHFVSMKNVTANMDKNMVVTGIKFIDTNHVIQMKIQTGRLIGGGTIDRNSLAWLAPEELSHDKYLSYIKRDHVFTQRNSDDSFTVLENEKDIAIFNRSNKAINLDALLVPKNHVITGVKFSRGVGDSTNPFPLQLEIQATPFDYKTGNLDIEANRWLSGKDMSEKDDYKRARIQQKHEEDSKNPVNSPPTVPNFTSNKFIELDKTSLKGDFGQTVIPLLDAVPVTLDPPRPLAGLSLFYKAARGYGGFLSFGIIAIDRSANIQYF